MTEYPAKYHYEYKSRKTGEVLLSGTVSDINKNMCKKKAHIEAMQAGLKPYVDPDIQFFIKAEKDSKPGFDQNAYIRQYNEKAYDRIELKIPKGMKDEWKAKAKAEDKSLTEWIMSKVAE